jgi:Putative peptidoglycan binding domain
LKQNDVDTIRGLAISSAPFLMTLRFHAVLAATLLWPVTMFAQPSTAKSTTPAKRIATTKTRSTTPAARIPVHTSSTRRGSSSKPAASSSTRQGASSRPYVPPRPSSPSSDRYREIQESLISRGYLQGPANGVWDQNSADAMRKFQTEQKMDPTGKISAKALISLGLGPKDESIVPPTVSK